MDGIKALGKVLEPDMRSTARGTFDAKTRGIRSIEFEDHYKGIAEIELSEKVPESIREHFDISRNILIYSWYVYRFIPVAEMHAAMTLEMALKFKTGRKFLGLKKLLAHAVTRKWIVDEGFSSWHIYQRDQKQHKETYEEIGKLTGREIKYEIPPFNYVEKLIDSIPFIRNYYAHGDVYIHPGGRGKLIICAESINQLFEKSSMKYFAYGSNLLSRWMLDSKKVTASSAKRAVLKGYRTIFNKLSIDGSGKLNIARAPDEPNAKVEGVLYEIDPRDWPSIIGGEPGYKDEPVNVEVIGEEGIENVPTFIAKAEEIRSNLKPTDWYLNLILTGAKEHKLSADVIAHFEAEPFVPGSAKSAKMAEMARESIRKYEEDMKRKEKE